MSQAAITVESKINLGTIAHSFETLDGKVDMRSYFNKIERWADLYSLTGDQLLKILQVKVEGDVAVFVETELLDGSQATYTEFKRCLLKQFAQRRLPGTAQVQLLGCTQEKGETVRQFAARVKALGLEVVRELTDRGEQGEGEIIKKTCKTLTLSQFKTGLSEKVKKQIGLIFVREPDLTFDEAWEVATAAELSLGVDTSDTKEITAVEDSTQNEENLAYVKSSQGRRFNGNSRQMQKRPPLRCYNCNETGHIAANCNVRIRCWNCKKWGHMERNCKAGKDKGGEWLTGPRTGGTKNKPATFRRDTPRFLN